MKNRKGGKERAEELNKMSDEDLMTHFQQGAIEAFNILVKRYSEPLYNFISRFLGDEKESEDILQETFLRVYRNRHSYRRIAKFSTWLYTIASNLARTEYRKRKRRKHIPLYSKNRSEEEYEIQHPYPQTPLDENAGAKILERYIQEALNQLPENFREVVVLRDVQQLTYDEIAEITGLPMGTVKSRINRGRTKLKNLLKDIYPFAGESELEEEEAEEMYSW